jgi:hypothetical protein
MNRNINKLSIEFLTNIPNKKEIVFTRKLLYHPDLKSLAENQLSQYPYLVTNQMYKISALRSMRYVDRVAFFFNETKMLGNKDAFLLDFIDETDTPAINECVRNNVLAMLEALFPTKYPHTNDVKNSFDILKNAPAELPGNPNVIQYSYLKDGKTYTFRSLIWLNDLLNHPNYKTLMKNYVDLDKMVTKKKNTYMSTETRIIDEKIKITGALAGSAIAALKKVKKTTQQIIGLVLVATVLKHLCEATVISSYSQFMDFVTLDILTIAPNWITEEKLKKSMDQNKYSQLFERIEELFGDANISADPPKILKLKTYKKVQSLFRDFLFDDQTKEPTVDLNINSQNVTDDIKKRIYDTLRQSLFDKSFDSILQEYNVFQSLYETSLKDSNLNAYANKYPEYRQFIMTLQSLTEPRMSSSNGELQKLLNCETKDTAIELYSLLNQVSGYYFKGEKTLGSDPEVTKRIMEKINVGITNVAVRNENEPRLKIHVLGDFFGGELNDDKMKVLKCKIEGERLGDQLLALTSNINVPHPWDMNKQPAFLDVDTMKSSESASGDNSNKNKAVKQAVGIQEPPRKQGNNLPVVSINDINAWFLNEIKKDKNKTYLEKMDKLFAEKNVSGDLLSIDNLVESIQKKNPELYGRLVDLVKQQYAYSSDLRRKLNALMLKYNSQVKLLQDEISEQKKKLADSKTLDKLGADLVMYQIYEIAAEFLFDVEKKKEGVMMSAGSGKGVRSLSKKCRGPIKKYPYKYTRRYR